VPLALPDLPAEVDTTSCYPDQDARDEYTITLDIMDPNQDDINPEAAPALDDNSSTRPWSFMTTRRLTWTISPEMARKFVGNRIQEEEEIQRDVMIECLEEDENEFPSANSVRSALSYFRDDFDIDFGTRPRSAVSVPRSVSSRYDTITLSGTTQIDESPEVSSNDRSPVSTFAEVPICLSQSLSEIISTTTASSYEDTITTVGEGLRRLSLQGRRLTLDELKKQEKKRSGMFFDQDLNIDVLETLETLDAVFAEELFEMDEVED
jgi:hypothetical protein